MVGRLACGAAALVEFQAGVIVFSAVDEDGYPFSEALAEEAAVFAGVFVAGFTGGDGAIVGGAEFAAVVGDAEHEESEVDQDIEDGLAGHFGAASPPSGGAEGAADFAVDLHPVFEHGFVPEAFHFPGEEPHIGGAADGDTFAPVDVIGFGVLDIEEADFGFGDAFGAFGDEFGHFGGITGVGVKEDEDTVHGDGGG
ncbi:MAG: hypothetical protein RI897_3934 [Verrucomicrobiota bacterium]